MSLISSSRSIVVAAATCGVALALSGVSAASPSHSAKKAPTAGVYLNNGALIATSTEPSAYATDNQNYEHFVQFRPNGSGDKGRIVYFSRKVGAKTWLKHYAPGAFDLTGHPRLEIDPDGDDLFIVAYTCSGVSAVQLGDNAARLDAFTEVSTVSDCKASAIPLHTSGVWNDRFGDRFEDQLHVVVPDLLSGGWDLITGLPGQSFGNAGALPDSDQFVPSQMSAAGGFGSDAIVGQGVNSAGNRAVYETDATFDNSTAEQFSPLKDLGGLGSATHDYIVDSVAEFGNQLDVGLYEPPGTRAGQTHTLFMDERDASGQWTSPIPIPHTGIHDRYLILSVSPATQKLRSTFERVISSPVKDRRTKSGILTQRRLTNWTKPMVESHWWKDTPLSVTYDSKGIPYIFYRQVG